jgi:periplasmic protein TonB
MQKPLPPSTATAHPPQLWLCLTISLALHAGLAAPWLYSLLVPHARPESRQLVLDLSGLESQHQVEHLVQKTPEAPKPEKTPAPHPTPAKAEIIARSLPTDMPIPPTPEQPRQEEQKTPPPPLTASQDNQTALEQHIAARETEEMLMKRYLTALTKNIQSHLAYPASARDQGQVGTTRIRFTLTESGEIQPDSLSVQTSSGSPLLDSSALKAAQAAAPFMPPPRRMNVSIGLSFFKEG